MVEEVEEWASAFPEVASVEVGEEVEVSYSPPWPASLASTV